MIVLGVVDDGALVVERKGQFVTMKTFTGGFLVAFLGSHEHFQLAYHLLKLYYLKPYFIILTYIKVSRQTACYRSV
jgi:hypothetical protein